MLRWETGRPDHDPRNPLAAYTARMLARKSLEQAQEAGDMTVAKEMSSIYEHWDNCCFDLNLTKTQRRRLANDSHALVVDGLDRHGLWRQKTLRKGENA